MHNPRTATPTARAGLTLLILLAAIGALYRVYRAASLGWWDLTTSAVTLLLIAGVAYAGWRRHIRFRVQATEWRERVQKRQGELLDGDEDRALWDSIEPASLDDDTCAIGLNVVAIDRWRNYPRAG